MRKYLAARLVLFLSLLPAGSVEAQTMPSVGPPGGDVRSLVADTRDANKLYLGTSDGHVFFSGDGAGQWRLLGRVGGPATVVFTLLVDQQDSSVIYAGTWSLGRSGGGVYRSTDSGKHWVPAGLAGQTVRALAQAPSDSSLLFAGTLDGVYSSRDSGQHWERISPAGHADLLNFDSVAVDPRDADAIYAGTYHLAWKTTDGGRNWLPIHAGMIDDSDVMSIVLDRANPDRVFATACSGMYRSENRGERWVKIQGIPATARRTHFIRQDPGDPQVFYAGTTQGLWKSTDGSLTWKRVSPSDWSIIGLVADPRRPGRLVVGLERRGVVVSEDGGATFRAANHGFDHQQTFLFAMERARPERMLVVLTNAAEPVRATEDGGRTWRSLGPGLRPELTRQVYAAPGEWWAALDRGGLQRYDQKLGKWLAAGMMEAAKPPAKARKGKKPAAAKPAPFKEQVRDMDFAAAAWYAATDRGLHVSRDRGRTWSALAVGGEASAAMISVRVSADGSRIHLLGARGLMVSTDSGKTWSRQELPAVARDHLRLHAAGEMLVLGSDSGLYLFEDDGQSWRIADFPGRRIAGFAAVRDTLLVSTENGLHFSHDRGENWERLADTEAEGHFPFLARVGESETILVASATEGLRTLICSAQSCATGLRGRASRNEGLERTTGAGPAPANSRPQQ